MKKLSKEIKKWGHLYKQIDRDGMIALYEVISLKPEAHPDKPVTVSFETIIIQEQKEAERFGNLYPATEAYPSSGTWGTYGWTFTDLNGAYKKFNELC